MNAATKCISIGCVLTAALLVGCGNKPEKPQSSPSTPAIKTIEDGVGRRVALPEAPPRRIVSLSPAATDILMVENAHGQIAGATRFCKIPEADESHVTRIGGITDPDYERIVALKPDLVVVPWLADKTVQDKLTGLGLPVVVMHAEGLDGTIADVRMIGGASGHAAEGEASAHAIEIARDTALKRLRDVPVEKRPRVLIIMDDISPAPGSYVDDLLAAAGGRNVLAKGGRSWLQVSPEAVLQLAPDVILEIPSAESSSKSPVPASAPQTKTLIIATGAPFYRPGPDLGQAIWILARTLYPERFSEALPPSEVAK